MSGLTTHILDLAAGRPAAGVAVRVSARRGGEVVPMAQTLTDADGRARLVEGADLAAGGYRLEFEVADYFKGSGAAVSDPPFLDVVVIDFAVADASQHHHVPLLVSPFGYSTYRGS
ncbi:MAG: hydroxyisourate hydrolase [Caulobacter sp.]|nr:hydroxyisourate hydrolase [Caulobacter sp.]